MPEKIDIAKTKDFFAKLARANDALRNSHAYNNDVAGHRKKTPFMPCVMMRTNTGDKGIRPLADGTVFWESPDIWTFPAAPNVAPDIPPVIYQPLVVGQPNTVYAHVWNLGRAPIAGCRVEWYWFNPALGFTTANAHPIGVARVDLAPRGFDGCHKLVKCPTPWVPVMENGGHECLIARVSAMGDPLSNQDQWKPTEDRHVAQRNVAVVNSTMLLTNILASLELTKAAKSTTRLFQVGNEGAHAVQLVAPHLKLDAAVQTHMLAEVKPTGELVLPPLKNSPPLVMPHTLLNLGTARAPKVNMLAANVKIDQHQVLHQNATVTDLLHHGAFLHPDLLNRIKILPPPKKTEAQVLRVINYQDNKAVGGYTIVVTA